jgi:glycosyltransferase involved in cell wall biosynthesis
MLTIGIDATNLRQGGGRTHLVEFLRNADPLVHGFFKVVIWAAKSTLEQLHEYDWLEKRNPNALEGGLLSRVLWQHSRLSKEAQIEGCDVLLVPGGSYAGNFHLVVTMSQNMLPFEWRELKRYGLSWTTFRLLLLRWAQTKSMRRAEGVIFLTRYAEQNVQRVTGAFQGAISVIPHGVDDRFLRETKLQRDISSYSTNDLYRIVYVSIVDQYKHQWNVVHALGELRRRTAWPIRLDLVGPSYPPALARLKESIQLWDPHGEWVGYHGNVSYQELHSFYHQADLGLFASSCENMPIILLETMASGLPVAASNRGPMPEILGDAGLYFDPEDPQTIGQAVETLISSPKLRSELATSSYRQAQNYSWAQCADQTLQFLAAVHEQWRRKRKACAG